MSNYPDNISTYEMQRLDQSLDSGRLTEIKKVQKVVTDMMMAYATSANLNELPVTETDAKRMLETVAEELEGDCRDAVHYMRDNGYAVSALPDDSDKLVADVVERANRKLAIRFIKPWGGYQSGRTYTLPDTKARALLAAGPAYNAEN